MRVLQVIKTNRGASWAFNQAKKLKDYGVDIVTVLPNDYDGYAVKYKEAGMQVIQGDWELPIKKPWKIRAISNNIRKAIEYISPDIIHLHFVSNVLMCRIALRRNNIPRLFQVPGPLHLENPFFRYIDIATSRDNDFWAGACKKTCDIYRKCGVSDNKLFLAYYGNLFSKYNRELNHSSKLRKQYEIQNNEVIIAMISYFYKPKSYLGQRRGLKGHEDFIDALRILKDKYPQIRPVVIGNAWDGSEKYELKVREYGRKQLGEKIIFTGYRDDVAEIYPEIDIVVHPSHSENLGGAAESLQFCVPTIATYVGGFPDIVFDKKTGLLVEKKNPRDLANAIEWMINNSSNAKEMAKLGKHNVDSLLDISNTSRVIFEVYNEIIKRN